MTTNLRTITIGANNTFTAGFTNTVPLESLVSMQRDKDFGGSGEDRLFAMAGNSDRRFLFGGTSASGVSGNKSTANFGFGDFWVVKVDRDEKLKGVSWCWVIPAPLAAGFLMVKAPMLLAKILSGATMGAAKTAAESHRLSNVITNQSDDTLNLFAITKADLPKTNSVPHAFTLHTPALRQNPDSGTNEVYLTGISTMNGKVVVDLSNGEIYSSDDRELQFLSKRVAIINGKNLSFSIHLRDK